MSKQFVLQLPIIEFQHQSGVWLSSIATDLECQFLNRYGGALARQFSNAIRKHLLREGKYREMLQYFPDAGHEFTSLPLEIRSSEKRLDEDSHVIQVPILTWHFKDGAILATAPTLGIGFHNKTTEGYRERLREIILLNFKRENRFDSYQSLIAAQWFDQPVISPSKVEAEFYTPNELMEISQGKEEPLLPKTASRMNRSEREFFGIDHYLDELALNVDGEYRQSVLIVGPSGCGKTALVHAYEQLVGRQWDKKPWTTSAARLIQVLTESGSWQYGLGKWVAELRDRGEVVYIGNLTEWFEVGQYSGNSVSIAEALRDPLQRNEVLLVAEVTPEQLHKLDLRSPGYREMFHVIEFSERLPETENRIALSAIMHLAKHHKIHIREGVVNKIILLHRRYTPYSGFPGKTIRFFESLILHSDNKLSEILEKTALQAFCEESGMPKFLVDQNVRFERDLAEAFFSSRVIGQSRAVGELVDAIMTTKAGMARTGKPIMSMLFVGPTGVGKTQLAKTLAQYIFGDEQRMIRFDMSEYGDPYAVPRLTAVNQASLVAKVRQQPFSVVLFDEIEKAAHNFFDLLLQVLGEGRLTDDRGDVANFCSTIIIMTSNLGAGDYMRPGMGFASSKAHIESHFESAVTTYFRPELFNRIDRLIPFVPLSKNEREQIIRREVEGLLKSEGITQRPVEICIDDCVWEMLSSLDIDFRYGARAIQRALQQCLFSPLAEVLSQIPHNDPTELTVSWKHRESTNTVNILQRTLGETKKTLGFFAIFVDEVAAERRLVQGLGEGSVWIGLQSELDQLEQKQRRKKDKFWENPAWIRRTNILTLLVERYAKIEGNIFELEKNCLTQVKEEAPLELWEDYKEQLSICKDSYKTLLFDVESIVHKSNNTVVMAIYGSPEERQKMIAFYERIIERFNQNYTRYGLYKTKNTQSFSELLAQIDNDKEEAHINHVPADSAVADSKTVDYWISARELNADIMQTIGVLYYIEGPCAAHYYMQEKGLVEFLVDEKSKKKLFVDVVAGAPEGYNVPWGVERKEFYKVLKVSRSISADTYVDARFDATENSPNLLANHGKNLDAYVRKSLINSLVKQTKIAKNK